MASKDIKYLGIGLGIGIGVMSLFLGTAFLIPGFRNRVLPSREFVPTSEMVMQINVIPTGTIPEPMIAFAESSSIAPIPTNTQELLPLPTLTLPILTIDLTNTPEPIITATLSPADLLAASGDLAIVGPLTREQQLNIYNSALTFIAPSYAESKKMSVAINNLRFSDPSTTCGPLSLAILKKAAILNTDMIPHDFFLINPDNVIDRRLLEKAFPEEQFSNTRYKIKLNKVNWSLQPLYPGDFLYIYSGEDGNFEHMLVVTRVDSAGRAYSVTNYNTEEGFVINETMLYDPTNPTAGIFYEWTKRKEQILGSTGFAGYEVWRSIQ